MPANNGRDPKFILVQSCLSYLTWPMERVGPSALAGAKTVSLLVVDVGSLLLNALPHSYHLISRADLGSGLTEVLAKMLGI